MAPFVFFIVLMGLACVVAGASERRDALERQREEERQRGYYR